jgi:hypothetical protein
MMAPSDGPLKMRGLQDKCPRVPGADAFGGRHELECLFSCGREKYCHNGGMALADLAVACRGSKTAIVAPSAARQKEPDFQEKGGGVRDPRSLGPPSARVAGATLA